MKLKKFFEIRNTLISEDKDNPFDDDYDDGLPNIDDIDEIEGIEDEDVVETLLSTLRKMAKNYGFEKVYVFTDDEGSINIQFVLNHTEKISSIMKVMGFLKKLESDILIQYEADFDLWETKDGYPLLTGKFYYDENVSPSNEDDVPF